MVELEGKKKRIALSALILNSRSDIIYPIEKKNIQNPLLAEIFNGFPNKKTNKIESVNSYEEMFSEVDFHPIIAVDLIKDLSKTIPKNSTENIVILEYALESVLSIFYSFDTLGKCKGVVETINLLCNFPDTPYTNLITPSISYLFTIFINVDEEKNYRELFQSVSYFLINQEKAPLELLNTIYQASLDLPKPKEIDDNSFISNFFTLFSMLFVDKAYFFDENAFSTIFSITEQYIYKLNEYALSFFQHLNPLLPENIKESFINKLTTFLPGIVEKGEPHMEYTKQEYVTIDIPQSPSSVMQFKSGKTFSKKFEFSFSRKNPLESNLINPDISFPCFSLLFKSIGASKYELERFLTMFLCVAEARRETSYYLDYLGLYSLCLARISEPLNSITVTIPEIFTDPSIHCENEEALYTVRFTLVYALLTMNNLELTKMLTDTVRYPLLFSTYIDILNEQTDLLVKYIKYDQKIIQDLGFISTQLKCANYDSNEHIDEIESARASLFRLFYSLFQRQGMLELFLSNHVFISFFLSLLFEEGIQGYAFSQLRLYLSSNTFSEVFKTSLQMVVEQIVCTFTPDERYLNLILKLVDTLNKSVSDFSTLTSLCEPLTHVLVQLEPSDLSSKLIFSVAEFYLNCNSFSSVFNTNWFSAIGKSLLKLSMKDQKTFECLVQLAAGNFISKIEPLFILENPYIANIMFTVFYETDIDIISFLIKLCSFSDENAARLHQSQFDLSILRYINKHPDHNDENLIQLFCMIASVSSSPAVVQMYLSLLAPMDNRYVLSSLTYLINPLKNLIERAQLSPEVYMLTSEEYTSQLQQTQSIKGGFSISCWLLVDTSQTKLFRMKDNENCFLDISCNNSQLCVNGENIPCQIPRQRWSYLSMLIHENSFTLYIDSNLIDTFKVPISLKFSDATFIFGGSGNTKITNISLSPPVTQLSLRNIWRFGMRFSNDLYNSLFFLSYRQITRIKPNMRKPFADILLRSFGIKILLPLLAHLDLKTKDGKESDLTAPIVISLLFDALMVGEKEEIDFVEAGGTKIILHLLTVADEKHLTYDLYLAIFNIFEQVLSRPLQISTLRDLVLNLDLWCPAKPEHLIKIISHWTKHVFTSYTVLFLEVMSFQDLLKYMRLYFWYTPIENAANSSGRRRSPDLDVEKCRKIFNKLALNMASARFTIDDYKTCLLHALTLSDTKQRYDILCLVRDIAKIVNSPISYFNSPKLIDLLSIVNTIFNTAEEKTLIVSIETIILVHKKAKVETKSLPEHLGVVFQLIKSHDVTESFLSMLYDLLKSYPVLFSIVSYFAFTVNSIELYTECNPSSEWASITGWCIWAVSHAIKYDQPQIFDTLALCTPKEWKNIYGFVEAICRSHGYNRMKYCPQVLTAFLNYMINIKINSEIADEIIDLCIQFITFHSKSVNKSLRRVENESPFKENFDDKEEEEVQEDISYETILDKTLLPKRNIFTLAIKETEEWNDLPLAHLLLEVIDIYPTKKNASNLLLVAAFVAKVDFSFMKKWIKKTRINITKLSTYYILDEYLNRRYIEGPNEAIAEYFMSLGEEDILNSFVSVYENAKNTFTKSFKEAMESFYEDQNKSIDSVVLSLGLLIECIRTSKEDNAKLWRRLWRNASVRGGPWATEKKQIKWKRDSALCAGLYPCKMKPNRKFDLHIKASIVRDTGNSVTAETELEKYEKELKKKYSENAPPEVFEADDDDLKQKKAIKADNVKLYSFACELITLTKVVTGRFDIYQGYCHIGIDESQKIHVIQFSTISSILYRRRFHHKTGIEIFLFGGKNYLLNFPNDLSSTVVKRITEQELPIATYVQKSETPQFFKSLGFTEKWVNNELTNFEYLMRLNIFSGRSFNDPSQYPFFPWTIIDFERDEFNLKDETMMRDLSKPVGSLGQERLDELIQRLCDMKQFGQTPFLYSSFAICPLSLFLWNVRMEPFTSLHIDMQSGKFDHATRLFTSISDTFKLALNHLNDYRELIPEFFFQSEFLVNENGFDLGNLRGKKVGDVELPKFVKSGSAIEFIYLMRKSLESDYVSEHLNDWIDLFWGYKQRGKAAEKANNIFNPFMYETIWTKENLKNPDKRASIEASMCHVGQFPPQIFSNPHPKRHSNTENKVIETIANINFEANTVVASNVSINEDSVKIMYSCDDCLKVSECKLGTNEIKELQTYNVSHFSYITSSDVMMTDNGKIAHLESGNIVYVEESLTSISHVASCQRYHAIVSDEATLNIVGPRLRAVIPFFGECITCVAISVDFSTVICGTISGNLVYCSLVDASKINAVKCDDFVPTQVAITPSWGFIISTGVKEENGTKVFCYNVHDINGKLLRKGSLSSEVTCITAWADSKGFDHTAVGCADGKVFSCEAFYGFGIKANRLYSKVTSLLHCKDPECIIAVAENGNLYFVPSNTK